MARTRSHHPRRLDVAPGVQATSGPHTVDFDEFDVTVVLGVDRGRLVADELRIMRRQEGPPVTGEALRRLPVDRVLLDVKRAVTGTAGVDLDEREIRLMRAAGPIDETLRAVATLYRYAWAVGEPPTAHVGQRFGVPRATAARWVATARRRGFLDPAEGRGKAGG